MWEFLQLLRGSSYSVILHDTNGDAAYAMFCVLLLGFVSVVAEVLYPNPSLTSQVLPLLVLLALFWWCALDFVFLVAPRLMRQLPVVFPL